MINGLLLINKPAGPTSHDMVVRLRRILRQRRIGHAGTLDPPASGLLVILLGRATRLLPFVADDKVYEGTIKLGIVTDTLDASGRVIDSSSCRVDVDKIREAAASFIGPIEQAPPMVSAVKVAGKPLYRLARRGMDIERPTRIVKVFSFNILKIWGDSDHPEIDFRVHCSKGTYIRVLAVDLGARLGCGAHLACLKRTRVGDFSLRDALEIEEVEELWLDGRLPIIPLRDALPRLAELVVDETGREDVANGRPVAASRIVGSTGLPAETGQYLKIASVHGELFCVAESLIDIGADVDFNRFSPEMLIAKPVAVFVQPASRLETRD